MNWLHYLLEANLYLGIFYIAYCLFLNKETHYTLNRIYLLFSCIISFVLPVLQIGALKPIEPKFKMATIIMNASHFTVMAAVVNQATTPVHTITTQDVLIYLYFAGVIIMTVLFLLKLYKLAKLTRTGSNVIDHQYKIVSLEAANTAFSFFNYLFIGTRTSGTDIIIKHELVHIRQKHSLDIVFLELVKIISWFNPFIYLLQISLKTIHEYIADEQIASIDTDTLAYSSFLVNNAYGIDGASITHSFFNYNLLKKRIIMLNQKRSGNLARLKYLITVPVCAGMLCSSTLAFSKNYVWFDLAPANIKSLVKAPATRTITMPTSLSISPKHKTVKTVAVAVQPKSVKQPILPPALTETPEHNEAIISASLASDSLLYKQFARTIAYPAEAVVNNITGYRTVGFSVKDGVIDDIKFIGGLNNDSIDKSIMHAFKKIDKPLNMPSGEYRVSISFNLNGITNKPVENAPKSNVHDLPNIAVYGYGPQG